jgi:hypothetical protein
MLVYCQRHSAVLLGSFSCCEKGHEVARADGRHVPIPCDKIAVRKVLTELLDLALGKLREAILGNVEFDRTSTVWDALHQAGSFAYNNFTMLLNMKRTLLAESVEEQDWEANRWSPALENIGDADLASYWEERCLGWPQPPSSMLMPALEGNLPMLRYFVERLGYSAACHNPFAGVSVLQVAARGGHIKMVQYLCHRPEVDVAHINFATSGLGTSALGDAAMRNHPRVLEVLLSHRADVNTRRKNGKTPLHAAAEEGNLACVEVLLAANADIHAIDHSGRTAADLALSNSRHLRCPSVCMRIHRLLQSQMPAPDSS